MLDRLMCSSSFQQRNTVPSSFSRHSRKRRSTSNSAARRKVPEARVFASAASASRSRWTVRARAI